MNKKTRLYAAEIYMVVKPNGFLNSGILYRSTDFQSRRAEFGDLAILAMICYRLAARLAKPRQLSANSKCLMK